MTEPITHCPDCGKRLIQVNRSARRLVCPTVGHNEVYPWVSRDVISLLNAKRQRDYRAEEDKRRAAYMAELMTLPEARWHQSVRAVSSESFVNVWIYHIAGDDRCFRCVGRFLVWQEPKPTRDGSVIAKCKRPNGTWVGMELVPWAFSGPFDEQVKEASS
jgi:hypothetical protein